MYDDIIDVCYPFDLGHSRMSLYDRSSQFMPFSALVGYKEAVLETSRITSDRVYLDDEMKDIINNKINFINSIISSKPIIDVTYFVPDLKKTGGCYKTINGFIDKIDIFYGYIFIKNEKISIENIVDICGDCFKFYE